MTDLATYVSALDQTWNGMASACTNLLPAQWDLPTEVPGWSVKDHVAHQVHLESVLLGEPHPADTLPTEIPHVRNEAGRFMEVGLQPWRAVPGDGVLRALRSVAARRLAALRALPEPALDEDTTGVMGKPIKTRHLLGIRVFDAWTHEQDVRRALGHPGGLTSEAARLSLRRLLLALTGLAEDVPSASGRVLALVTTGALPSESTLRLGPEASLSDGASVSDVRATLDFETFVRLGTGRVAFSDVEPEVALEGDVALGQELMRHLAVTP